MPAGSEEAAAMYEGVEDSRVGKPAAGRERGGGGGGGGEIW